MKKLLFILIVSINAISLFAQINVIKHDEEEIANLSKCGFMSKKEDKLIRINDDYYLQLSTSNKFDGILLINIGKLEEAIITFKDIQDKWFTMNGKDSFIIGNAMFVMNDEKKEKNLIVSKDGMAGVSVLYLKSIQACYMVLRNISINSSQKNTDGGTLDIVPASKQETLEDSGTTASQMGTQHNEDKVENNSFSIADELLKLHELKEKGVLTEEEFKEIKSQLLKRL